MIREQVVIEALVGARQRSISARRREISAACAQAQFRNTSVAGPSPDLNHTSHGIGPIQRALSAANELQASSLVQRKGAEVESPTRLVDRDPIDNDFVVSRLAAADEQGGERAALSRGIDDSTRQKAHCVRSRGRIHGRELLGGQRIHVSSGRFARDWSARGGYHHGFGCGCETQLDSHFALGGNIEGFCGKARGENSDPE